MKIKLLLPLFFGALLFQSCIQSAKEPRPAEGQSGYLTGKVTDQSGRGVAGATVYIENTVLKGQGAEVKTGNDGRYQIAVAAGLGQWISGAYRLTEYNGRVYKMALHPDKDESFSVEEKPVRNFEWKIQGHMPDLSLNLFYGGSAELYPDPNSERSDSENIEFTFQPDGPLIDGSAGKTLKLSGGKPGSNNRNRINDIPIGRYRVTAVYKPTGQRVKVGDAWDGEGYADAAVLEFKGTEASYRANQMGIGFEFP